MGFYYYNLFIIKPDEYVHIYNRHRKYDLKKSVKRRRGIQLFYIYNKTNLCKTVVTYISIPFFKV